MTLLCLLVAMPSFALLPAPEQAEANVCDVPLIGTGCEVGGWVGSKVGGGADLVTDAPGVLTGGAKGAAGIVAGEVGKAVGKAIEKGTKGVFGQLTEWVGSAAGWLFLKVITLISETTSPNLFHKAFLVKYQQILALAAVLTVGVVAMAVIEGGRRGDAGQLVSMMVGALPLAAFGMIVGLAIIQLSLNVVDALSMGVGKTASTDIESWFKAGAEWMVKGTSPENLAGAASGDPAERVESAAATSAPGFVLFISALLGVIGAFGLWLELLLRDAAIYVCSLFMPLGLAASVWPRWAGVLRKTFEILICLVVSKFFIVMVVALAASFLGKPDGIESVMAGSAMMIVALLMPFMLIRVIPFMEGALLTSGAAGVGRSTMSTTSQVAMMRFHMGAIAGHSVGRAAGVSTKAGGSSPQPGGPPGSATTGQNGSVAAATSRPGASASQSASASSATQPTVVAGSTGQATPRPAVASGHQQQTVAEPAQEENTAPASSSAPRPAPPAPARREEVASQAPTGQEPLWGPSTAWDPKPAQSSQPSSPPNPGEAAVDRPPVPDPPRPKRMSDG